MPFDEHGRILITPREFERRAFSDADGLINHQLSYFLQFCKKRAMPTHFNASDRMHFFQASACGGTCPGTAIIVKSAGNSTRKTPRRPLGRLHFSGQTAM